MAMDFEPRGDQASAKNVKATSVKTWPIGELGKKVPTDNNGAAPKAGKK